MGTFLDAAHNLATLQKQVNPEVHRALQRAADRVVAAALPEVGGRSDRSAQWLGLRYRGPYDASGGRVSVQFRPTFVARWKEGGAKAHTIDPSAAGTKKNLSFQRRKFKSAFRAQEKTAAAKTAKSRDRWTAKGAAALSDASRAQQGDVALGVLAIGRGKGRGKVDVQPGAKPMSNFTRRVSHPGIPATRPIARAIVRIQPQISADLRRNIDDAWATVGKR